MKPVLKWAGGKAKLALAILDKMPARVDYYCEPFAGGAAVFFALAEAKPDMTALLVDRNEELVVFYRELRETPNAVIGEARALERHYLAAGPAARQEIYMGLRRRDPRGLSRPMRAARFLFLNKTCFNGLWRVNKAGAFNVPHAAYDKPTICDEDALRRASELLQRATLMVDDYERAPLGDSLRHRVYYFDPPYIPASPTANFTAYAADGFTAADHERLAAHAARLRDGGARVILSNSDTPRAREFYEWAGSGWNVECLSVRRSIAAAGNKRAMAGEILVWGGG